MQRKDKNWDENNPIGLKQQLIRTHRIEVEKMKSLRTLIVDSGKPNWAPIRNVVTVTHNFLCGISFPDSAIVCAWMSKSIDDAHQNYCFYDRNPKSSAMVMVQRDIVFTFDLFRNLNLETIIIVNVWKHMRQK